jgi:hypothetical protein
MVDDHNDAVDALHKPTAKGDCLIAMAGLHARMHAYTGEPKCKTLPPFFLFTFMYKEAFTALSSLPHLFLISSSSLPHLFLISSSSLPRLFLISSSSLPHRLLGFYG